MTPITGPYTFSSNTNLYPSTGYVGNSTSRTWYRQKRPYNLPLTLSDEKYVTELWSQWPQFHAANSSGGVIKPYGIDDLDSSFWSGLHTKARNKFSGNLGDTLSIWITLAERRQALEAMVKRVKQVSSFTLALKNFRFKEALEIVSPKPDIAKKQWARLSKEGKLKASARHHGSNYLEFHFGWSPLVSEITGLANLLSSDIPSGKVKARVSEKWEQSYTSTVPEPTGLVVSRSTKARITYEAQVQVSNPNLYLAQQVGLLDIALVPIELVSYSFVLDWGVNLTEFFRQFTDFAGVDIIHPNWTVATEAKTDWIWPNAGSPTLSRRGVNTRKMKRRTVGSFPAISLVVRRPWQLSARRGLAAASLLAQRLK